MKEERAVVFVIDDDASMRTALDNLVSSVGLEARSFASAREFLAVPRPDLPSCLVLDVRLPGISGLALQEELVRTGIPLPIVFITGHGDVPMTVRAMKAGAVEFLTKPFDEQALLDAIHAAIERDRKRRNTAAATAEVRARFETLTERERQVMRLVAAGRANKEVAAQLGLSVVTVKAHRAQVMQKLGAGSIADLVRIADQVGAAPIPKA